MEQLFAYFTTLPIEKQCEILSFNISLPDLLSLRLSSTTILSLTNTCVQYLSPYDKTTKEQTLVIANLVLELRNLKSISFNYPVMVNNLQQIIQLARHPNLTHVYFKLSRDIDFGAYIAAFLQAIDDRYKRLGCQLCGQKGVYNYYFTQGNKILSLADGIFSLSNVDSIIQYDIISIHYTKFPLCQYIGFYDPYIEASIFSGNCLHKITQLFSTNLFESTATYLFSPNVESYNMVFRTMNRSDFGSIDEMNRDFITLHKNKIYSKVREFYPIIANIEYITGIKRIFPNLSKLNLIVFPANEDPEWWKNFIDLINSSPEIQVIFPLFFLSAEDTAEYNQRLDPIFGNRITYTYIG